MPTQVIADPVHATDGCFTRLSFGMLRLVFKELAQHDATSFHVQERSELQALAAQLQGFADTAFFRAKAPARCAQPESMLEHDESMLELDCAQLVLPEANLDSDETSSRTKLWCSSGAAAAVVAKAPRGIERDEPSGMEYVECFIPEEEDALVRVFKDLDQDGGGTISTQELRDALLQVGVSRARAVKLLNAADVDQSGEVDLEEWRKACESGDAELRGSVDKISKLVRSSTVSGGEIFGPQQKHRCMIHPGSPMRRLWDIFVALQLLYISMVFPVTTIMDEYIGVTTLNALEMVAFIIDMLLMYDVVLNFRTGYISNTGSLVMDPRQVAYAYLRSWFLIDFVSSVPLEQLTAGHVDSIRWLKILKVGKIVRASKFVAVLTSTSSVWDHFDELLNTPLVRSVVRRIGLIVFTVVLCHWMACGMLVSLDWIEAYQDGAVYGDLFNMYLAALYWAMTTMTTVGYGDITPVTNSERIISLITMVMGGLYYGYAIGNICSVVADRDLNARAYHERMDLVYSWIEHHRIPSDMKRKILRHFKTYLNEKAAAREDEVFNQLSSGLQKEVSEYVMHVDIRDNPLFDGLPANAVIRLQQILEPMLAETGQHIVTVNEAGTAMFIVREGELRIELPDDAMTCDSSPISTSARYLSVGDSFGEEILAGLVETYRYTVAACTDAKLWMIGEGDFANLFQHMPHVLETVKSNAGTQRGRLRGSARRN